MDSGLTIKARPSVAPRSQALRDAVAVREPTETELHSSKVVTAAADSGTGHDDGAPHHEAATREFVIDPQSQEALFGAVDISNERKAPNQALLLQRAYLHHQGPKDAGRESAVGNSSDPHADIEA